MTAAAANPPPHTPHAAAALCTSLLQQVNLKSKPADPLRISKGTFKQSTNKQTNISLTRYTGKNKQMYVAKAPKGDKQRHIRRQQQTNNLKKEKI